MGRSGTNNFWHRPFRVSENYPPVIANASCRAGRKIDALRGSNALASQSSPCRARVLVVDDDVVFSEATARVLRAAGFEVSLAPDHRLALEDLESTRPIDLLITDIVMPDRVNGVALSPWPGCVGRGSKSSTSLATISRELRTRRTALSCASQSTRGNSLPK
jgi:CheY-like chemotaxis protein